VTVSASTDLWTALRIAVMRDPGFNIRTCRSGWVETRNPVYVWEAVAVCTEHKKPLPDWIMAYLAEVAQRMTSDDAKAATDLREVLPRIMGFPASERHGPGRRLDPGGGKHEDALSLAVLFAIEIEHGLKPSEALRKVAAKLPPDIINRDERTLWRWLMKEVGLKCRPRTNAEWRAALRSHFKAYLSLLDFIEQVCADVIEQAASAAPTEQEAREIEQAFRRPHWTKSRETLV
jgi:hypothetical protein